MSKLRECVCLFRRRWWRARGSDIQQEMETMNRRRIPFINIYVREPERERKQKLQEKGKRQSGERKPGLSNPPSPPPSSWSLLRSLAVSNSVSRVSCELTLLAEGTCSAISHFLLRITLLISPPPFIPSYTFLEN